MAPQLAGGGAGGVLTDVPRQAAGREGREAGAGGRARAGARGAEAGEASDSRAQFALLEPRGADAAAAGRAREARDGGGRPGGAKAAAARAGNGVGDVARGVWGEQAPPAAAANFSGAAAEAPADRVLRRVAALLAGRGAGAGEGGAPRPVAIAARVGEAGPRGVGGRAETDATGACLGALAHGVGERGGELECRAAGGG
mmetsp:Transcript_41199/g.113274  ORF Transcript_41199/g.113274 Transcript_41199/m.113274 type:complete len:200 (-) Transcript_41199:163-762(-)|eukprot:7381257-Prymnesium_polylepis.2